MDTRRIFYSSCNLHWIICLQALKSNCDGFSCWESQLRDTTRTELLNVFDEFRSKVFDTHYCGRLKNTKHRSIFQMVCMNIAVQILTRISFWRGKNWVTHHSDLSILFEYYLWFLLENELIISTIKKVTVLFIYNDKRFQINSVNIEFWKPIFLDCFWFFSERISVVNWCAKMYWYLEKYE